MKVYKFGGASVKDADAVKNALSIVSEHLGKGVVIVSAMGKSTNMLEAIWKKYMEGNDCSAELNELIGFHEQIVHDLDQDGAVMAGFQSVRNQLIESLDRPVSGTPAVEYDRIVSFGELWSTAIIATYAKTIGLPVEWFDVRNVIVTDNQHRSASVLWEESQKRCDLLMAVLDEGSADFIVTQGFMGRSRLGNTTTLGREGSDFSGAILAYLIHADELVIWKDVPGMLNADPKWFKETQKLKQISYAEAIELSYYGASVIHPKTVKPLQNKGIPLRVKSFKEPSLDGTLIHTTTDYDSLIPSYIFKPGQSLVSISPRDFSFVDEKKMVSLFQELAHRQIHIQLLQNSALSLSLCIDSDEQAILSLRDAIANEYSLKYNLGLELWTVRHANQRIEEQLRRGKELIIKQQSRHTLRMLLR